MATAIKGQNLRLYLNTGSGAVAVLAAAKNCSIQGNAQIEDATTKDTPTGKTESSVQTKTYTMSTDSLVVAYDDAKTWLDAVGETVDYEFCITSGNDNSTKGEELRKGKAIIESVSVTAPDRQDSTLSISLTETYVPAT